MTGGAGHIGSNLIRELLRVGACVRVVDNLWRGSLNNLKDDEDKYIIDVERDFMNLDLTLYENCVKAVKDVDVVFHLADVVAGITFVFDNQPFVFRTNMLINSNMIKASWENSVDRYLYTGAACSYPLEKQSDPNSPLLKEEDAYPAHPESAYGWSKLMGEYECELYSKYLGMKICILRLHNVYGPYSDLSPEKSQVIPALIRKAILYPREPFIVWGDGSQTRAFVYVADVVRAMMLGIEKGINAGPIQIGTDKRHTIREIAEIIVSISGKDIPIIYDASKPMGDMGRAADWCKAKNLLGWSPMVPLDKGIAITYEWAKKVLADETRRITSPLTVLNETST